MYLHALDMLSVCAQEFYPYHISNVVSNDELYGSDAKFIGEINTMSSQVVDQILHQLKAYGDGNQLRFQSSLALELFVKIVYNADVSKDKMFVLVGNLWNLAMKNRSSLDAKQPVRQTDSSFYSLALAENIATLDFSSLFFCSGKGVDAN